MDLPMQPSINQRPWLAMGLLLAFAILLMAAYAYLLDNMERGISPGHQKEDTSKKIANTPDENSNL
jgi:hypothetical protein